MLHRLVIRLLLIIHLFDANAFAARLLLSNGAAVQCDSYHICPPGYECMYSDLFVGVRACYADVKERGNRPGRCPTMENPLEPRGSGSSFPGQTISNSITQNQSTRPRQQLFTSALGPNPYSNINQNDIQMGTVYAPLAGNTLGANGLGPYTTFDRTNGRRRKKRQWPPVIQSGTPLYPPPRFPILQDSVGSSQLYPGSAQMLGMQPNPFGSFQGPPMVTSQCGPVACNFDGDCPPMQKCCYSMGNCNTRTCMTALQIDSQPTVTILMEGGMDRSTAFLSPQRMQPQNSRGTVALVQASAKNILWDTGSPQQRLDLIQSLRDVAGLNIGDINYLLISSGLPQYASNAGLFSDVQSNVNDFSAAFMPELQVQAAFGGGTGNNFMGTGGNNFMNMPGQLDGRGTIIGPTLPGQPQFPGGQPLPGQAPLSGGTGQAITGGEETPQGGVPISTSPALNAPVGLSNVIPPQNRMFIDGDHNLELVSIPGLYAALIVYNARNLGTVALVGDMMSSEADFSNDKFKFLTQSNYRWSQTHLDNRRRIFCKADFVVPGQGKMFRVTEEQRRIVGGC